MFTEIMNYAMYGLGVVSVLAIALWGHLTFWSWYYKQKELCGPLSWVYRPDGWRIALEAVPPRRGAPELGRVICCPGLACNGRIFHFREGLSMAQRLADEGWSVWILHPRGTGHSERPLEGANLVYGYEDYVQDAVAVAEFIRSRGEGPVLWVGHSLGGLVGLDLLTRHVDIFDGIVTLGTPITLKNHPIGKLHYSAFKWFFKGFKTAYLGKLSTLVAPWSGWFPSLHPAPLYVNFDLISKADLRVALAQCFEDTPRRVLDEFVNAIENGSGPWDRLNVELSQFSFPLLAIAGDRDGLAPLEVTSPLAQIGPRGQTTWRVFEGYSHLELALSDGAISEVTLLILEWAQQQFSTLPEPIQEIEDPATGKPETTNPALELEAPLVDQDDSPRSMISTNAG